MSRLEELSQRLESADDMRSIVRVMKTMSLVSITQSQHAARRLRAYSEIIDRGLHAVMMAAPGLAETSRSLGPAASMGLVAFGSEQGLCGRFNEILAERVRQRIREHSGAVALLAVGTRGGQRLEAMGHAPDTVILQPASVGGLTVMAEAAVLTIDGWQSTNKIESVEVVFNRETEQGGVEAVVETLLPIDQRALDQIAARRWPSRQLPTFDAEARRVFSPLVRERMFTALMRAGAEAMAAEHTTRLSAMQAAEKNIAGKVGELQALYRHERQDAITNELMDIVAAYETLAGEEDG